MVPVHLLERPTISITGTDNEFHHAVCNRQVLVKSSHVDSMHWKLDFCFPLEQNSNLHHTWMGWDIYIPCDNSVANIQRGFWQSQLHPSSQFSMAQANSDRTCCYSQEHKGCDGLRNREGRKQQEMLWSTLQQLDFEGWIWLNFLTSFWLGRRWLWKGKPKSSQTGEGLTLSVEPLDVRVQLDSHWQRGGETSNITEILVKEHISRKAYPADVPNFSSYLASRRRFLKDINY